jgi:hypothetical protein
MFIIILLILGAILLIVRNKLKDKGIYNYNLIIAKDKLTTDSVNEFNRAKSIILNSNNPDIEINKYIEGLILEKREEYKNMRSLLNYSYMSIFYGFDKMANDYALSKYEVDILNKVLEMSYNLRYRIQTHGGLKGT